MNSQSLVESKERIAHVTLKSGSKAPQSWSTFDRALDADEGIEPGPPVGLVGGALDTVRNLVHIVRVCWALQETAAASAAERCSAVNIQRIKKALRSIDTGILRGGDGAPEDVEFHLAVAAASNDDCLLSAVEGLRADLLVATRVNRACGSRRLDDAMDLRHELQDILSSIEQANPMLAALASRNHMVGVIRRIYAAPPAFWRGQRINLTEVSASTDIPAFCAAG